MHSKVNIFTQLQYVHKDADYWLDLQAPYSTKQALEGALSVRVRVRSDKEVLLRVQRPLIDWTVQEDSSDGEDLPTYWVMSLGLSFL